MFEQRMGAGSSWGNGAGGGGNSSTCSSGYPKRPRPQSPPCSVLVNYLGVGGNSVNSENTSGTPGRHFANSNNHKKNRQHRSRNAPVNPYQALQIRRDATQSEIKHAYKRLALWHHPGRLHNHEDFEERNRRYYVFEILAACCETLLEHESRKRCDELLAELENEDDGSYFVMNDGYHSCSSSPPPQQHSPLVLSSAGDRNPNCDVSNTCTNQNKNDKTNNYDWRNVSRNTREKAEASARIKGREKGIDIMPTLSRASSDSSLGEKEENKMGLVISYGESTSHDEFDDVKEIPSLVAANSSSDDESYIHYTASETERLFGGPLALLYKARKWRKFTDPYIIFERVFGTALFSNHSPTSDEDSCNHTILSHPANSPLSLSSRQPTSPPQRSAAWTGSSRTLATGEIVYETTRILHNKKLTKTETISYDPETGKKRSHIAVTSEDFEVVEEDDFTSSDCFLFQTLGNTFGCCRPFDCGTDTTANTTMFSFKQPAAATEPVSDASSMGSLFFFQDNDTSQEDHCQRWQQFFCMGGYFSNNDNN